MDCCYWTVVWVSQTQSLLQHVEYTYKEHDSVAVMKMTTLTSCSFNCEMINISH